MIKPNLFILGAPKCGTSSLAYWLGEHPQIFMSPLKEPLYFDTDHDLSPIGDNLYRYEALFENANHNQHKIVAEASTKYLSSEVAVENILEYNPQSLFVVLLRNPVEMAYSLYRQELFSVNEDVEDFSKAWALQEERRKGNNIPHGCIDPGYLQYGNVCSTGTQCENLLKKIDKDRVRFILLDDLKEEPLLVYKSLLAFLGIEYDGRTDFKPRNTSKTLRSKWVGKVFNYLGYLKKKMGIYKSTGFYRLYSKEAPKPPLADEMRQTLENYFDKEIRKLERILDRDLSCWFETRKSGVAE